MWPFKNKKLKQFDDWGNVFKPEPKLLSKTILLLYDYPNGRSINDIFVSLFPDAGGGDLTEKTLRILRVLLDEKLIDNDGNGYYRLSGAAISLCNKKRLRNHPYERYLISKNLEFWVGKPVPVFISCLSLLVSIVALVKAFGWL